MKKLLHISLLLVLVACDDQYENTHRYSKSYYLSKDYPIFLDASEVLVNIQVQSSINHDAAFKIVSNDRYIFVGEKMKGIHVYEKTDAVHATPLCFIECKLMKAFDVAGNILYCNNFVDLLAVDVENPLQAKVIHRKINYFNNYWSSSYNMPIDHVEGTNVYVIGYKQIVLTGIETDTDPAPDFSEYDQLYENMIVKEIPDDLQLDKPYAGFANVDGNILTFGFNGLAQCSYTSDGIQVAQLSFQIPNYFSVVTAGNLQYKDGMILIIGRHGLVYLDYHHIFTQSHTYLYWNNLLDVVSLQEPANSLVLMSGNNFITGIVANTNFYGFGENSGDATSLINVNDTILALGNQLTLYRFYLQDNMRYIEQVKQYSGISGTSMLRDDDILIVANRRGLSFYDISDLENITAIP